MMKRFWMVVSACAVLALPVAARGQALHDGKLLVTVTDATGGVISGATVTVTGEEAVTKAATLTPVKTTDKGLAIIEGLVLGQYTIVAEFPGFDAGTLKGIHVKSGDNKHVIVLPLKKMEDSVTVGQDKLSAATSRTGTFGSTLTREQIDALSDDPDEMQQQLMAMAGPNAQITVDSFNGAPLPNKSQIKSIHISRDQYSAEQHWAGGISIEIVTQPGGGPLRGNSNVNFRDSALNAASPKEFATTKAPERIERFNGGLSGTIVKNKSGFSLNLNASSQFTQPLINITTPTGPQSMVLPVRQPSTNFSFGGTYDNAITKDHVFRLFVNGGHSDSENRGIGQFDQSSRAYSSVSSNVFVRALETGPLRRRMFISTKFMFSYSQSVAQSVVEAPTIVVNDAFTSGGAQRAGGSHNRGFSFGSDLDYVRGKNSFRTGVQIDGGISRSNDQTNYLGTYTFASLADYEAGIPRTYTKRVGNPNITYADAQIGMYVQDDIRISKQLSISPGLRYETQLHVTDYTNFMPRVGLTWAPFKSGKTSVRASWGIFHDWLSTGTYAQTVRVDGSPDRQQDISLPNPTYPDPGPLVVGTASAPSSKYLLGQNLQMPTNQRVSAGFSQQLTKLISAYVSYSYSRGSNIFRGENLNPIVNGVRANPAFADIIQVVADAASRSQDLSISLNGSLPTNPANKSKRFDWRRMSINGYVDFNKSRNNSDGSFSIPANADLSKEWGPSPGSQPYYYSVGLYSTAVRNLSAQLSFNGSAGSAYNITTGFDNNGDFVFNDRPAGVSRDSARTPGQYTVSARVAYSLGFGKVPSTAGGGLGGPIMIGGIGGGMIILNGSPGPAGAAPTRYHMNFSVSINNLTNHENLVGFSGVVTSPYFGKPTGAGPMRKVDFSVGLSF